jgi:hypothetical protein
VTRHDVVTMLRAADVIWDLADEDNEDEVVRLNMNDQFAWALAEGPLVPPEKLKEVGELFMRYGFSGLLYWVSERDGGRRSEFEDVNRFIDHVRQEERLRAEVPDSNRRAYHKLTYQLGGPGKG